MKTLVTGGTGMLGNALQRLWAEKDVVYMGSDKFDLKSAHDTSSMFYEHKPDTVIHLAANVGGVQGNLSNPMDYFYDNLMINTNVITMCRGWGVTKLIVMLSTCIYPDNVKYPILEKYLHDGPPHYSNYGYAYAKRMAEVCVRAIRQQDGLNYVSLVPTNLYGPNDNFDLKNGHFVAAVVRKVCDAKRHGLPDISFWGDGRPIRQFTYVDDMAAAIDWAIDNYNSPYPLNVGNSEEATIKEVVETVVKIVGYRGNILWDTNKPSGQYKKTVSTERLRDYGFRKEFTLVRDGLRTTCDWYNSNYPNIRM